MADFSKSLRALVREIVRFVPRKLRDAMRAMSTFPTNSLIANVRYPSRLVVAPALLLLSVVATWVLWRSQHAIPADAPLRGLVVASQKVEWRTVEPRLSGGFAWKAFRSPGDSNEHPVTAAALTVVERARRLAASNDDHAGAIGSLVAGDSEHAIRALEGVGGITPSAAAWSDLAAARYIASVKRNEPWRLGNALAAADAALRLEPSLPEAWFNRALIVERLGLRDLARASWQKYLSVDNKSDWAGEARQHIAALQPAEPFSDSLERIYDQLALDESSAERFVAQFPQEARTWGETRILGRWADAEIAGNHDLAAKHLAVARALGEKLVEYRGDHMLAAAVAAIDRAAPRQRADLAHGHVDFREAQTLLRAHKAAAAQPLFERAMSAFEKSGSPLAAVAQYFFAITIQNAGRMVETRARLETLLSSAPTEFPAHRAQLQWELGRVYALTGRWGDSLAALSASVEAFTRLGELQYAATVRQIIAEVHDRIGNPTEAWQERMIVLHELGRNTTPRLRIAVASMAETALANGEIEQAASFLGLELEMTGEVTPVRRVFALLSRAKIHHKVGSMDAARSDLASARAEIERLADRSMSAILDANTLLVDALLAQSPQQSIELLTRAADAHRSGGRDVQLPEVLLHRARAYVAVGDHVRAAADCETAIALIETMRESLPGDSARWGVFDTAGDLFDEAIRLALERNDTEAAWLYVERARARQLLDLLGAAMPQPPANIPEDAALVEYFVLPSHLLIFVIDRGGIRVFQRDLARSALLERVKTFSYAIAQPNEQTFRAEATALHRILIEPVASWITSKKNLVLIGDAVLSSVPFAALLDGEGHYLVERHNVIIAPSAAVYARLMSRDRRAQFTPRLLILANPSVASSAQPGLPDAEREALKIAQLHRDVMLMSRDEATASAFVRHAPQATLIHFAGHAISAGGSQTALVLASEGDHDGRVNAETIAAMRLPAAPLVLLAGCNTARGETRRTEGTISVARAFLAAGAPRVIATLQPVDDKDAARFFVRLHELLARGLSPADALRAVQLEWIQRPGATRATWAAVQLIGS